MNLLKYALLIFALPCSAALTQTSWTTNAPNATKLSVGGSVGIGNVMTNSVTTGDWNSFNMSSDGTIHWQAGQGSGNGSESFMTLSDGLGQPGIHTDSGFFNFILDDGTTGFDANGQPQSFAFYGQIAPTLYFVCGPTNGIDPRQDVTIAIDGAASIFGTGFGNRIGRSFHFYPESNEVGGPGGNSYWGVGQGDTGQPSGNNIITNAIFVGGDASGLTNLTSSGIATNGSLNGQVLLSSGGVTTWGSVPASDLPSIVVTNNPAGGTTQTIGGTNTFNGKLTVTNSLVVSGGTISGNGSGITNATTSYLTNLVNGATNVNNLTRTVQWTIPVAVSAPAGTLGSAEIDAQIQRADGVWATVADCDIAGGVTSIISTNKEQLVIVVPPGASMRVTNSTSGTGYVAGLDAGKTNTFTVFP